MIDEKTNNYIDLTDKLVKKINNNFKKKRYVPKRRLKYSLDIYMNKYYNCYFDPLKDIEDEIIMQVIIERYTGYKTYLNPKTKKERIRTPDFWIKEINELWDLKGINGNSPKTIDTIFKDSRGQTENIILKPKGTNFTIKEIKEKIDIIYNNNFRKHIKQTILLDRNNKVILYYKR